MISPELPQYGMMAGLAGIGGLARGKQWIDPVTHQFIWSRFITELSTAVGLGVVIVAVGDAMALKPAIVAGLCVGAGWLGPASVSDLILSRFGLGAKKEGTK